MSKMKYAQFVKARDNLETFLLMIHAEIDDKTKQNLVKNIKKVGHGGFRTQAMYNDMSIEIEYKHNSVVMIVNNKTLLPNGLYYNESGSISFVNHAFISTQNGIITFNEKPLVYFEKDNVNFTEFAMEIIEKYNLQENPFIWTDKEVSYFE